MATRPRCQVCGRNQSLRQDGRIGHHHLHGRPCYGVGEVPYSDGCEAMQRALTHYRQMDKAHGIAFGHWASGPRKADYDGYRDWAAAVYEVERLSRRLANWQRLIGPPQPDTENRS